MSATLPCIRPEIEAVPTEQSGEVMFVLHDSSGLSEAQLAVSPAVMFIIQLLDGNNSLLHIRDQLEVEAGTEITQDDIQNVLDQLDKVYFLLGPRFDDYLAQKKREFMTESVRAPLSIGTVYNDDPAQLTTDLNKLIAAAPPAEMPLESATAATPRAAIAPHIDFARGGPAYGQIFRELRERKPPEAVIILGTAHYPMRNRFSILDKDFEVPGGVVKNATEITKQLLRSGGAEVDFAADAFAHRSEHSIEFQAVWLHHIWGETVPIVPVLVGSMYEFIHTTTPAEAASEDAQLTRIVHALQDLLSSDRRIMLLASADLSHVGPRFGDAETVDESLLEQVEASDRAYLDAVVRGDAMAALNLLRAHQDQYHICGSGCIYTLGAALESAPGRLLGYHQAANPEMEQAVSFASILFE